MFGWLAHAFASTRPSNDTVEWSISRCSVAMTGSELATRLPWLGSVLFLPARRPAREGVRMPRGWLAGSAAMSTLLQVEELRLSSMIGPSGPREWIDGVDAQGHFCARLHLLPDTDYLAWDALLQRAMPLPAAPLCPGQLTCMAGSAGIVGFHTRRLAALQILEAEPLRHVSALGREIAREVARHAALAPVSE